jgi:hypothetical protein
MRDAGSVGLLQRLLSAVLLSADLLAQNHSPRARLLAAVQ